ncbi:MAG: V-type ATP synthase subunit A [Candidatus Micrarchaeia archaeon]
MAKKNNNKMKSDLSCGKITRVSGPVVEAEGFDAKLYDVVKVGEEGLIGEIIKIIGDTFVIQVYEDTTGLKPGEKVQGTGQPLSVELGPGLLKNFFDGVQRPLKFIEAESGSFIKRGITVSPLDRKIKWDFKSKAKKGDKIQIGDILGTVQETELIEHKIISIYSGKIESISSGKYTIDEVIGTISSEGKKYDLTLTQKWVVRNPRPYSEKFPPNVPLITGQRSVDTFFPISKGGTACIPGAFGTGKTVSQQTFAKYSDTQIIVYVGCGERGNEMTEVLTEFPELIDPNSGKPLMERTILIANTSNMPVAAREASIYTGITIAEYYRDQGYDVALMADSTSRWAEAMREIGGRLEEMPGEEGYPAYLGRRVAEFYERAGRVKCLGSDDRYGSISIIGAVSPPGGDLSEPVSQNTLRVTKVFLALDSSLAQRRHFPAFNWLKSYSLYTDSLEEWFAENVSADFSKMRKEAMALLQKEAELQEIVQLVGPDALPEKEQGILLATKMLREDFLQQNAYSELDAHASLQKQYWMLKIILNFYQRLLGSLELGVQLKKISSMNALNRIARMKEIKSENILEFEKAMKEINSEFDNISKQ